MVGIGLQLFGVGLLALAGLGLAKLIRKSGLDIGMWYEPSPELARFIDRCLAIGGTCLMVLGGAIALAGV